jgi:hypothetical protein
VLFGQDPLRFLGLHPQDQELVAAVLNRAQEIRTERERGIADYVSGRTAGLTARAITRWIARAFK